MSQIIEGLLYTKHDEWVKVDGDFATIGITDYAQDQLSDIVFLELPDVDTEVAAGDEFGVVESVKAAAELFAPVSGTVTAINDDLIDEPEALNDAPYQSWMLTIKMSDTSELEGLMSAEAYAEYRSD